MKIKNFKRLVQVVTCSWLGATLVLSALFCGNDWAEFGRLVVVLGAILAAIFVSTVWRALQGPAQTKGGSAQEPYTMPESSRVNSHGYLVEDGCVDPHGHTGYQ